MAIKVANPGKNGFASNNFGSSQIDGSITSRTIFLGVMSQDEKTVTIIGGLSDGSISVGKNTIPIREIGSDETVIVPGRTQPFQMQVSKMVVNGYNILRSLMPEDAVKEEYGSLENAPLFIMNLSKKIFKKPRTYVLVMYPDGISNPPRVQAYATNTLIQGYSMNVSSEQEIVMENVNLMGSIFAEKK